MRVTVLYQGIPVGVGDLTIDADFVAGDIDVLPAYEAIRPTMHDAWRARLNFGYLALGSGAVGGVDPAGDAAGRAALEQAETVLRGLELRDERGGLIATEWIDVSDDGGADVALMAEVSVADAATPAWLRPRPHGDADAGPPAA